MSILDLLTLLLLSALWGPLFAMMWGAIALQEPITESMIVGCSLILLGTAIANELFSKL